MPSELSRLQSDLRRQNEAAATRISKAKTVDPGIYARVQVDRDGRVIAGWEGARSIMWVIGGKVVDALAAREGVMTYISPAVWRLDCICRLRAGGAGPRGLGMFAVVPPGSGHFVQFDILYSSDGMSWTSVFDTAINPLPIIQNDDHTQFGVVSFDTEPDDPTSPHPFFPITLPEGYYLRLDLADISDEEACAAAGVTVSLTMDIVG